MVYFDYENYVSKTQLSGLLKKQAGTFSNSFILLVYYMCDWATGVTKIQNGVYLILYYRLVL